MTERERKAIAAWLDALERQISEIRDLLERQSGDGRGPTTSAAKRYLTAKEAAEIRRKNQSALAKERERGEGPPWIRDGARILYPADELERYLADRLVTGQ
jgi:hypothetical protein